jgi:GMP synthase-like glutamine amidotransferase
LRIAILETGYPPEHLIAEHGTYPDMLRRWLGPQFDYAVFDVQQGAYPDDLAAFDAVAVMGSPAGVYEPDAWIGELLEWLRAARGRTRTMGICFGHQAIAQAWGGEVRKAPAGWGLGLHRYEVRSAEPWMGAPVSEIAVPVSHQDQVLIAPAEARVVAASAFTPHAVLAYGDHAISFQCHPEFTPAYAAALVERRRGQVEDAQLDAAGATLADPGDGERLAEWTRRFLRGGG